MYVSVPFDDECHLSDTTSFL